MKEKCCCSKEPTGYIPIGRIIAKIDALFAQNNMQEVERVLSYWQGEARALNDKRGLLEILSEQIGLYRKLGDEQKGMSAVSEALGLLACIDAGDSVSNATIYLNCATTMKAFGKAQEAMQYYDKAKEVFERLLPSDDFRLAGLYNNYATALADLKRYGEARTCYEKALAVLSKNGICGEMAVTYVNLAQMVYDEGQETGKDTDEEVDALLEKAYDNLNNESIARDGNYAYICEKCASAFGFFGYFLQKSELEERAKAIYSKR